MTTASQWRFPPEWHPQDWLWIGFPHDAREWPGYLAQDRAARHFLYRGDMAAEWAAYAPDAAVYIRPMYWGIDGDMSLSAIAPNPDVTGFALCLEAVPMAPATAATTLTRTRFRRPVLEDAVVNAKAGCLYPNNARMIKEAKSKGFGNALVADATGNVAETATANVFMVKDGEIFTPIANGTFLAGITRSRHISNLAAEGMKVHETVLTFEDFHDADEVFLSGNMSKVTPVTAFDDTQYQVGPVTRRVRELYWDWAASNG